MKNILLLTDFSKNAQNAIDYSFQLFKGSEVNFFVLYVHKVATYATVELLSSSISATIYSALIKNHKTTLGNLINTYKKENQNENYTFKSICDYDDFRSSVKQTVALHNIDLIVMGTNGASDASEVIFGSNTINVIRSIDIPVLIIPRNYTFKVPKRVLFLSENNEVFEETPLNPLMYILDKYHSKLNILTFEDVNDTKKNRMILFFSDIKHKFYTIKELHIDIVTNTFIQIKKIDLTAKIVNKKLFLNRLITGSSTLKIAYHSKTPLLIMHP
jgi:nucleotide-binding universal stress UspA family protein